MSLFNSPERKAFCLALRSVHLIRPRPQMHKRSSSDDRLLTGSIGVSPLRLHCGRAANYGSIIIPCACVVARTGAARPLLYKFYRSLHNEGRGALTVRLEVSFGTGNVSDDRIFNFQRSFIEWFFSCPSICSQRESSIFTKHRKKVQRFFLRSSSRPAYMSSP